MTDIVAPGDFGKDLSGFPPPQRLFNLMVRQLWFSSEPDAARNGSRSPLAGSGAYQIALKLCQSAKNGQHEATV